MWVTHNLPEHQILPVSEIHQGRLKFLRNYKGEKVIVSGILLKIKAEKIN